MSKKENIIQPCCPPIVQEHTANHHMPNHKHLLIMSQWRTIANIMVFHHGVAVRVLPVLIKPCVIIKLYRIIQ